MKLLPFLLALFVVLLVIKASGAYALAWWVVFLPLMLIPLIILIIAFVIFIGAVVVQVMKR